MTFGCSPCAMSMAAWVCRRSWKRTPSRLTAWVAGIQMRRRKLVRRSGSPCGEVKTRALSVGGWVARCAAISSQRNRGSTTERLDAVVFGSVNEMCPRTSDAASVTVRVRLSRSSRSMRSPVISPHLRPVCAAVRTKTRYSDPVASARADTCDPLRNRISVRCAFGSFRVRTGERVIKSESTAALNTMAAS